MKLLWLFVVLPAVFGQTNFGRSYLKNSRLCHQWNCVTTKLGLPDFLPEREVSEEVFRRVLPEGPWQDVLGQVLDNCYENRTRRYTSTCPGQALLHCVVDQMIDFCPVASTRKDDSCSPVSSLAGLRYMFSQSRYVNLEKSLPRERRPTWFLKNYFDTKCCDLPVIFNTTVLQECGFSSFMNYFDHGPKYTDVQTASILDVATTSVPTPAPAAPTTEAVSFQYDVPYNARPASTPRPITTDKGTTTQRWSESRYNGMPFDIPTPNTARPASTPRPTTTVTYEGTTTQRWSESRYNGMPFDIPSAEPIDPLDCCDMTKFIQPSWRNECDFHLSFKGQERLVISNRMTTTEAPTTTTTERANAVQDVMMVPHSCEQETCVFQRMGIISDTGILDIDGYMKMLQNFTDANPAWTKAKARVLTKCLASPVMSYQAGCEINNMLACTLDVLTENCPYKRKPNICNHGNYDISCQISSSKYRPKNRREKCLLPELIHRSHLQECRLDSLYKVQYVPKPPKIRKHGWFSPRYLCKESKEQTTCMMTKMGILNKYNFMDYFKMKDRIRQFVNEQVHWAAMLDIYFSAFINIPMYGEHCNSEKKLLNVIDAMLMTCPVSMRKNTTQCNKIFSDMTHTAPDKQNVTKEKLEEIMKHYHHVFMPHQPDTPNLNRPIRKKHSKSFKKPVYNFSFLNSKEAPPVRIISLKPQSSTRKPIAPPLIVRPVYLRPNFVNDGVFRSNPFWIHGKIANAHMSTSSAIPPFIYTTPAFESSTNHHNTPTE